MKLSAREMGLALVTGVVLLLALTVWVAAPRIEVLRERQETISEQTRRVEVYQHLLESRPAWEQRLEEVRQRLSCYPADMDVTADYLKVIERVARDTTLTLVQRRPQKEQPLGECFEMPIDCTWEGDLHSLVRFLFTLEQEPQTMSIEDLTVGLVSGGAGQLKGNFTLMCLYARDTADKPITQPLPPAGPDEPDGTPLVTPAGL